MSSDHTGSALARRLYLNVKNGGTVNERDMARLVEIIEGLEGRMTVGQLVDKIFDETDRLREED